MEDLVLTMRTKYTVRSRESQVRGKTIGQIRAKLPKLAEEVNAIAFIARVKGHVMALDVAGKTMVDTDPRQRDKRRVTHLYVVYEQAKDKQGQKQLTLDI
jgi:glutamate dehydrogenase/leucine dehydrogenase